MRAGALALLAVLTLAPGAFAQPTNTPEKSPADYFPTEVGRQWTYELRITAGKTTQSIIYTTRVIAHQEVPKVGVCAVFQASSGAKLLAMDWYRADRDALKNPKRQRGKQVVLFPQRVLLDRASLAGLPQLPALIKIGGKKPPAPAAKTATPTKTVAKTSKPAKTSKTEPTAKTSKTGEPAKTAKTAKTAKATKTDEAPKAKTKSKVRRSWRWTAEGGKAGGTIRVIGLQKVRLRYYGTLDCVVVEDTGAFESRGDTRTQWRRLWLAPQIGIVREVTEIRDGSTVTFATEAHLMRHE